MKRIALWLCLFAVGMLACGISSAQTQSSTAKPAHPATHPAAHSATDPALLHPATLTAKAPEVYEVTFVTTKGPFVVKVTRAWAPLGADRFYNLVKHHFYDDMALFRVVPGFVVQFGLGPSPAVNRAWETARIKDDPVKQSNAAGTITFATAGPNTRTTQVFVNLGNNAALDGQGFAAFGQVTSGMDVIANLYSGYGDTTTNDQGNITTGGKAYLQKTYPKLDTIKTATITSPAPAPAPTHRPAPVHKPAAPQS
ncbi:MAG TPA: peptidylprolyl isomerase [Candidatus Acidoferrum sp.]|nr:peptidylprolyl isomerase [Candidatus Acidoferrum sp.]